MALHPNPLSKVFLTGVIKERPDHAAWRSQYIGTSLLPMRDVGGYKLAWDVVQSENNLAGIYAINGVPVPGSDMLFAEKFQEVQNVMASRVIHPQDVMTLREPGQPAVGTQAWNMKAEAQRKVRDRIAQCDDEVDAQVEYLIMHAVQGQVVWPPVDADGNAIGTPMPQWGKVQMTITFPTRATFVQNISTLTGYASRAGTQVVWTDEDDSDPVKDLEVIAELIERTIGVRAHGSKLIMGASLMSRLCFNDSIISWVKGTESGVRMINRVDMAEFIKSRLGYTIQEYVAQWTYRTGLDAASGPTINAVPFLPDYRMLVVPPGVDIGYFAVAPSPDGEYKPGKYQWVAKDEEPPYETRVGEGLVGFPVCERIDQIAIIDCNS